MSGFQWIDASSSEYATTKTLCSLPACYSVLRLIGEVGQSAMDGAMSAARQGCLFARPTGAIKLKMPQAPAGRSIRKETFCFVFGLFKNEGPLQALALPACYSVLRLIVEVGHCAKDGAMSAATHGRVFARPTGAITLKMPQAPEGQSIRKETFCFVFGLFKNEGPLQAFALPACYSVL